MKIGTTRVGWIAVGAAVALTWGCSAGLKSSSNEAYSSAVSAGKSALMQGDGATALAQFQKAAQVNGKGCDALWGQVLAGIQAVIQDINPYVQLAASSYSSGVVPQGQVDVGSLVAVVLAPVEKDLRDVLAAAEQTAQAKCSFTLPSFPIVLGTDAQPIFKIVLGTEWHEAEAHVLASATAMIVAGIDFLLAHDLTFDPSLIPPASNLADTHSLFLWLRSLGQVFAASPNLLGESATSWSRMAEVPQLLSEGLGDALAVVPALETEGGDPAQSVLGYKDSNGDGLGGGDDLYLGVLELDVWSGAILGPLHFRLPNWVTTAKVQKALALGQRVKGQLDAVGTNNPHQALSLSDFNDFLVGLPVKVAPFPDALQVDLQPFFTHPKPVRAYLPLMADQGRGPEFLIEGEVAPGSPAADAQVLYSTDAAHFPPPYAIPQDCVYLIGPGVNAPVLPYLAYGDPTFNGAVDVNLGPLTNSPGTSCQPDPSGYGPATVYSLNKVIAWLIVNYSKATTTLPSGL